MIKKKKVKKEVPSGVKILKVKLFDAIKQHEAKFTTCKHRKIHYKKYICSGCGTQWFAEYVKCPACEKKLMLAG